MNSQVEDFIQKSTMFNDLLPRALCVFLVCTESGTSDVGVGWGGVEHEMIFAGPGKNYF